MLVGEEKPAAGINASSSGKCQQIDFSGIAAWSPFTSNVKYRVYIAVKESLEWRFVFSKPIQQGKG